MSLGDPRSDVDDAQLVEQARDGEERALNELVRRHHDAVYRVALRITRDEDIAADVSQDTFIKAFRGLDGFRGDSAFRTWLLTIASNEARGQLRKVSRRREVALEDVAPVGTGRPDAAQRVVIMDEIERARACLAELPEKQRLSVTLRLEEGLSFREIGEVIGSSEGAARVNYHHGVHRLREMLESE